MRKNMEIRKSQIKDFDRIKYLYDSAREYFKKIGIDQWQKGYPSDKMIEADILNGESFVCLIDGKIIAVFMSAKKKEPSYESIYDGWWRLDEDYVVLHRVAVDEEYKGHGIGGQIVEFVEKTFCPTGKGYIKADTHENNYAMQKMLVKSGFKKAGIIRLAEGSEKRAKRVAFDKILK